jgi:hypothetical protein
MLRNRTSSSVQSGGLRAAFIASGTLVTLAAATFLAIAGVALWAATKTDDAGYTTSTTHTYNSSKAALVSENLDIDLDGARWLMDAGDVGKVRINATSTNDKPVFVGVARTSDVQRYLRHVGHTTVTEIDDTPFASSYKQHGGKRTAPLPAEQDIWAASRTGAGDQTLSWDVADGNWSVVVMNADGSPSVHAEVDAGAKIPFLTTAGIVSGGIGLVLLLGAGAMFVLAARPVRPRSLGGLGVAGQA